MGLRDRYDFENLVNEAETFVLQELEAQLSESPEACTCQDCVLDMAAYALNHVKPYYRVSLMGSLYAKTANQPDYSLKVRRTVQDAIRKVQANRSHD
jgi:competence protein ComFB